MTIAISGPMLASLDTQLAARANAVIARLASGDPTLWGPQAEQEASVRLGWLTLPTTSRALLQPLADLAEELAAAGLTRLVLCGMGGSSLAPEVIAAAYGKDLVVLDSTDPAQVARAATDLERTIVLLASKSGSTIETDSQRRFFIQAFTAAGLEPQHHIVVVTDPGSPFDLSSRAEGYRVINADPNVGGRFSALSAFGLTPTALLGIDPQRLLDDASAAHELLAKSDSPATALAVAMAQQAQRGPLMTLASTDPHLPGLGDWIEQLVAESTGKNGLGVLPVVVESEASVDFLGADRLSVALGTSDRADLAVAAPLGAQFLIWEWATALTGHLLGIDPFNQPNVTESKTNTAALLEEWRSGRSENGPDGVDGPIDIYGARTLLDAFAVLGTGDYLAIMAYLDRGADKEIAELRAVLAARFPHLGVTFGWGPRFLHSTGQFHKGGPQTGTFLQITGSTGHDQAIPGKEYGFATLQLAQALGDVRALAARGRPVIRLHLRERAAGIKHLLSVALSL